LHVTFRCTGHQYRHRLVADSTPETSRFLGSIDRIGVIRDAASSGQDPGFTLADNTMRDMTWKYKMLIASCTRSQVSRDMSWCCRLASARAFRQHPTSAYRAKTANAVTFFMNTSMTSREHPIVIATTHRNNAHPHTFRRFSARCLRSTIYNSCSLRSKSHHK
jgi:hypothetical protein